MLLSSFFTRSMVFAHIPRAQLLFALLSETFLTIRQNSLNVTVCMIARSSCRGYFIHSLSTLYYYNAPSLATRLTGDYRDRTFTGKCGPASLDTQYKKGAIAPWMITHLFCNSPFIFHQFVSLLNISSEKLHRNLYSTNFANKISKMININVIDSKLVSSNTVTSSILTNKFFVLILANVLLP